MGEVGVVASSYSVAPSWSSQPTHAVLSRLLTLCWVIMRWEWLVVVELHAGVAA